jgi:hypothetical protein
MDGRRQRESLTDDGALERDLEALLAVEPSPEFVARVRSRVAGESVASPWTFEWRIAAAAAIVILMTGGLAVWRSVSTGSAEPVKPRTVQNAVPPGASAPVSATPTTRATDQATVAQTPQHEAVARRGVREDGPRAFVEMTLPSVILADNEAKAYAQLRSDLRTARALPPAATPPDSVDVEKALEIDPLVIKPIVDVASAE